MSPPIRFRRAHSVSLVSALIIFLLFGDVYSQSEIPVDMYTGTPSIFIPIYSVSGHGLSDVVGISYNATGLKLEESQGKRCGVGWSFQAGASIRREVRGLPDDHNGSGYFDNRQGWLYGTIASDINNFSTSPDTLASTCSDENAVNTMLAGYNYAKDTEPDVFHYSAGSISGSFVFDHTGAIRLIPFQNIKIEVIFSAPPSDKTISSFKITKNDGVVYTFDYTISTNKITHRIGAITPEYLRKEFESYDYLDYINLHYTTEWKLSRVDSPSGAYLKYAYITDINGSTNYTNSDTVWIGVQKLNSSQLVKNAAYRIETRSSVRSLKYLISSAGDSLVAIGDPIDIIRIYDTRKSPAYVKEFVFGYQSFGSLSANTNRQFLKSITEKSQTEQLPPYRFTYINVDFVNNKCELPNVYSSGKDFWGYYNGRPNIHPFPRLYVYPLEPLSERIRLYPIPGYSGLQYTLPGADRTPEPSKMQIGTLESIQYPTGGATTFNYEPNDYYDTRTGQNLIGGGLRIKSIVYFDGVNAQAKIVKNFEYKEGGNSSGRLITKPTFAIPVKEYRDPETGSVKTYSQLSTNQDKWEYLTARSDRDLTQSLDGKIIGYGHVKVSRPGSGYSEYDYYLPATYGTGTSGQWVATDTKFVRPTGCPTMDIVANGGKWAYGFSPNPNFEYERGFLLKRTDRTEAGIKVRELTYTPQYIYNSGSAPYKVWGVSYDYFANSSSNVYFYGKYFLLTDVARTVSVETVTEYDEYDPAKNVTTSSQNFYESSSHKLLTKRVLTGADGSLVTTKYKYPLDYGTMPMNIDEYLQSIKKLQTTYRNGIPIEVTTSVQRPGESEKLIGASLTKFSDFGMTGKVLPYEQLSLKITGGITDFTSSGKVSTGIAEWEFGYDSRYQVDATFIGYDTYDRLTGSVNRSNIPVVTFWGFRKSVPVVQATNGYPGQFAFSDFETDNDVNKTGYEFALSAKHYGAGRTGNNALRADLTLSKTVQKAGDNYKLSFWLKKGSGSVDFTVKLKQTNGTLLNTITFSVNPATALFERVEKLIPVTSLPANFSIELNGNSATAYIDDVAFYPEKADLTTFTYRLPFGAASVTDPAGNTVFIEYDSLGRERLVRDQDGNIIRRTAYTFPSN